MSNKHKKIKRSPSNDYTYKTFFISIKDEKVKLALYENLGLDINNINKKAIRNSISRISKNQVLLKKDYLKSISVYMILKTRYNKAISSKSMFENAVLKNSTSSAYVERCLSVDNGKFSTMNLFLRGNVISYEKILSLCCEKIDDLEKKLKSAKFFKRYFQTVLEEIK